MADIPGTPNSETLDGTANADLITGLGGNDTLNGLGGNDTLDGGLGTDIVNGGDGDDILLTSGVDSGDQFNGGAGSDAIRLVTPSTTFASFNGPLGFFNFTASTVSSIEKIEFNATSGLTHQTLAFSNQFGAGFSTSLQLIGSVGIDVFVVSAGPTAGDYTMPSFTKTNWTTDTSVAGVSDVVVLLAGGNGNYTLRSTASHTGIEVLQGGNGNDTLIGGNGIESFIATNGTDMLSGGGGDDFFLFNNPSGQFNTYFNSTIDGGTGTDTLVFSGDNYFQATYSGIEKVRLVPALVADATHIGRPATYLELDSSNLNFLNGVTVEGTGTIALFMEEGDIFDGNLVTVAAGAEIDFEIYTDIGNDTVIGTTTDDYIDADDGNDTMTGRGGADIFAIGLGQDVITDFVVGTDKIDASGIGSFKTIQQFMSQVGADVRISFVENGVAQNTTIRNVSLGSLTADSFIFSDFGADVEPSNNDDTLFGSSFGDVLDGLGGNDLIFTGGGGVDTVNGGDGNDIVVINNSTTFFGSPQPANNSYTGGTGTDTLRIASFDRYTATSPVALSSANLTASAISGFEKIEFASVAGERNQAILLLSQISSGFSGGLTVVGGNGSDSLFIVATSAGDFSMPTITRTNWSVNLSAQTNSSVVTNSDAVFLIANATSTSSYTLRASTTHSGVDGLIGAQGSDILLGGNDSDYLDGGANGADQLQGGGGTDFLVVSQVTNLQGNYSDDIFDGGAGTDYLLVNGAVTFAGTLTNVEGIRLAPSVPSTPATPGTNPAALTISSTIALALGANALIGGNGSVIVNQSVGGTLNLSGWQFETAPIIVTFNGSAQSDTFIGTSHADIIGGGLGNDVLDGGSGADLIDGGAGDDRVYWDSADGMTNVSGGDGTDRLVLRDGASVPVSFDYAGRGFELLELENNDNAGSQIWSRETQLYNLAFQLVGYSTLYDDGSRVAVALDPGNTTAASQVVSRFDTLDRLVQVDQTNDDASRTIFDYDPANASPLASQGLYFDAQGRFDLWDQLYDDGRHVIINYDQANATSLSSEIIYYDNQARLDLWDRYFDDGSHQVINYDQANVEALASELITYDTQARLDLWDRYLDDGSRVLINFDQASATALSVDLVYYDSLSRIDIWDQNYDNGSRVVIDYDQANASALSSSLVYYDAQSHLDRWDQNYDNGSRVVIDYDAANATNLANELLYFDTQARLDLWDRNYDDGSRILVDFDQDNSQTWDQHVYQYNTQGALVNEYFV